MLCQCVMASQGSTMLSECPTNYHAIRGPYHALRGVLTMLPNMRGHAYSQSLRGSYNALRGSNMLSEEPTLTILPELSQIVTFSDDAIA